MSRFAFRVIVVVATSLVSLLCFVEPSLNALALMAWSIPGVAVIHYEGKHSGIPDITGMPRRIFILWFIATTFWFSDRLMCDLWLYLGTPYLHALFHLLSSVAAYTVFVMFALLDIERRSSTHSFTAAIRYFPKGGSLFSLPYITLVEKRP